MTAIHRDCLVPASNARWPDIKPLVSRGQIISTDLSLLTDGWMDRQTHNYSFSIMMTGKLFINSLAPGSPCTKIKDANWKFRARGRTWCEANSLTRYPIPASLINMASLPGRFQAFIINRASLSGHFQTFLIDTLISLAHTQGPFLVFQLCTWAIFHIEMLRKGLETWLSISATYLT